MIGKNIHSPFPPEHRKTAIYKSRREPSLETKFADAFVMDVEPPEL